MKSRNRPQILAITLLLISCAFFSSKAQGISLGNEITKTCIDTVTTVSVTTSGSFDSNNQFFIEFYTTDGRNFLLHSQSIEIVNNQIKFTYPGTWFESYKYVNVKIRSTAPALIVYNNYISIYSKPNYSYIYTEKTLIENGQYNKNDIVELPFKIYTGTDVNIETISGKKYFSQGNGDTRQFSYNETLISTGVYGIKRASNFCGTRDIIFGYNLKVNSEKFRIANADEFNFVCAGSKCVVKLHTENPLPSTGINFQLQLKNSTGQITNPDFTWLNSSLIIDIPSNQASDTYELKVKIIEKDIEATTSIIVKDMGSHSISGTYNVKYGESFLITGYTSQTSSGFQYDKLDLFLNSKIKLSIDQQRNVKFNYPKESGYYQLTNGFYTQQFNACKNKISGGIQVNVLPSINIESISSTKFCKGQEIFVQVSSNQTLNQVSDYKVRFGRYVSTEPFSLRMSYISAYEEIDATWVSANTIKFTIPSNSTISSLPYYYFSIVASNPNLEGIIYNTPIQITEVPNLTFANSTYSISPATFPVNYTTNCHDGWVKLSDGRTYPLEANTETGIDNDGYIRSMTFQTGTYFPINTWNQCGTGSVAGSYQVSSTDPSRTAVLLAPLLNPKICIGDTLWLDWISNGNFSTNNKFFVEFGFPNPNLEIEVGKKFVIIPNTFKTYNGPVRIKSLYPEVFSFQRFVEINGIIEYPFLSFGGWTNNDSVATNGYNPVVFYGNGGSFITSTNQTIKLDKPFYFSKDTSFVINQVTNGCFSEPFIKTLRVDYNPYILKFQKINVSCNNYKNTLRINYYVFGDIPNNFKVGVQFLNRQSGIWINCPISDYTSDEILTEIDTQNIPDDYCWIRFVRVDVQNNVLETLSGNFYTTLKKYYSSRILSSTLGNTIVSETFPLNFELNITPQMPLLSYKFQNPTVFIGTNLIINKDEDFFIANAYDNCGFVNIPDTVKVKFAPQITSLNTYYIPCKNSTDLFNISYNKINEFPNGTILKFYFKNNQQKFYIGQTTQINGTFSGTIPSEIANGVYDLGYETNTPLISKILANNVNYREKGEGRIISGTINKYTDDPFYIPFELKGGNGLYNITTNIAQYISFPIFGLQPITINQDGYIIGTQTSALSPTEITITNLNTGNYFCVSDVLPGKLSIDYLPNTGRKIYANLPLTLNNIPIKCIGGETQIVNLQTQGSFNVDNLFIPQISDAQGLNFIDVAFTNINNEYVIRIPDNIATGEGYRIRFRSTSPIEYGASSNSNIIIKPRPQATLSGIFRIEEGESVSITTSLNGFPPFNIAFNDGVLFSDYSSSTVSRTVSPVDDAIYTIDSISDKYCSGTSSGNTQVIINCASYKYLTTNPTENNVFKAQSLRSNTIINSNLKIKYKSGKSILLEPGFKVENNATFMAEMNGCN
ncbi:hypothetical protein GCM10027035_50520 [Emticicia sediminis]